MRKSVWYGLTLTLLPEHSGDEKDEHSIGSFFDRWYYNITRRLTDEEYSFEFNTKTERNQCYREAKKLMAFGLERWKRTLEK